MSPNARIDLELVRWLVWLFLGWTFWLGSGHAPQVETAERKTVNCAECGDAMRIIRILNIDCHAMVSRTLPEHSIAYLDSG